MAVVHFYLKKPDGLPARSLVYLQFKYNGRKLVYSFGQRINPADWSKEKNRVKSNRETILNGQYALNDLLDKMERFCGKIYNEELLKGIPPVSVLKFRLDIFMKQDTGKQGPQLYQLFDRFISGEIKNKGREKSPDTLKNYRTTRGHLSQFDNSVRYHVDFENINLDFLHRYTEFLQSSLRLKPNSIAKDIGVLKTVMSEAVDLGYTTNIQWRHKKFRVDGSLPDIVCLTEQEILALYRYDLSANARLGRVRDLFIYTCCTGEGSAGPLSGERSADITGSADPVRRAVAGDSSGPAIGVAAAILEKYKGRTGDLFLSLSNQKFNMYIKEAAREAGLKIKGRVAADPDRELWQCISWGTARRSFALNHYRAGWPVARLMKVTGHDSEKSFLKYIRDAGPGAG